jgi:predicted porin
LNYVDFSDTDSLNTYNVGAKYAFNAFTVGPNYDDSDQSGYIETTTLYASYQASDTIEIAVGVSDTDGMNTRLRLVLISTMGNTT